MWHLCVGMNADSRTVDMHRLLAETQLHMFGRFSILVKVSLAGSCQGLSAMTISLCIYNRSFMSAELRC